MPTELAAMFNKAPEVIVPLVIERGLLPLRFNAPPEPIDSEPILCEPAVASSTPPLTVTAELGESASRRSPSACRN